MARFHCNVSPLADTAAAVACSVSREELSAGYHCCGKDLMNGRGVYCLNVAGMVIGQGVADALLQAIRRNVKNPTHRSLLEQS